MKNRFVLTPINPTHFCTLPVNASEIGTWTWERLLSGGNGNLIEDLVARLLERQNLKEFSVMKSKSSHWDFVIDGKKVECRRMSNGYTKTPSWGCPLGFGSQLKSVSNNGRWQDKATLLDDGGYLFIKVMPVYELEMWWAPAKWFLTHFGDRKSDSIAWSVVLEKIEECKR